jgi:hypothetical protein
VETVNTIFENLVFIIPISKNIFEITGIDVIAAEIRKTTINDVLLFAVPIKCSLNKPTNGIPRSIGIIVAPTNNIT